MKKHFHFPLCLGILLAMLAGVTIASAQRNRNGFGNNGNGFGNNGFRNNGLRNNNSNVPGPTNYAAFGGFISVRNIFNPARYAIIPNQPRQVVTQRPRGPEFSLVGTMIYEKGLFAFFDGNDYSYRKVFYQPGGNSIVAGYTVTEITPTSVQLQSADKKTLRLNIGDVMRQQSGGAWQLTRHGELSTTDVGGGDSAASAATDNTAAPGASAAPSPALEGNSILQRLMKQRQQQLGN